MSEPARLRVLVGGHWARLLAGVAASAVLAGQPLPAAAQGSAGEGGHPVVQPLPDASDPSRVLNEALVRLGQNPGDAEALVAAGNAAMTMGDNDAAVGFFTRAERLSPNSPGVKAGLASAKARMDEPLAAISLFEAAERIGRLNALQLADRGLAYDLVGDNIAAQRYYREAIANGAGDEAVRRLALSLAIAGDRRDAEATLTPLLQKHDRAAWRTRAFALAILGREEEAVSIAKSTMPADLAMAMSPYLRYMRKLTPAQQAAAANMGRFPRASEIGQDDPRIAAWAAEHGVKRLALAESQATAPAVSQNTGAADNTKNGRKHRDRRKQTPAPQQVAAGPVAMGPTPPPELAPSREAAPQVPTRLAGALPAVSATPSPPPPPPPPSLPPRAPEVVRPAEPRRELAPEPRKELPPVRMAEAALRREPRISRKASFAEAFSAWGKTSTEITPAPGAVDIRKIKPRRPAPPPPPPPPPNPSRVWVQIGVGRDTDRIAFDWRKLLREEPELFKGRKPYVTKWVRTNRLLVGPFEDEAEAKAYNARLHKGDHPGSFVWISPDGQAIDPLDHK